jgi:homoserine kinase
MAWREGPVLVRVPATSANLGPGFDALGMALSLHDDVEVRVTPGGLNLDVSGEGAAEVAAAGERHLVVRAMRAAFDDLGTGQPPGLSLRCVNRIPHGRGLGSSAAAIVAGVLAARALAGASLRSEAALPLASALEGHPDNVAPCLLGGLTIAWLTEHPARGEPAARGGPAAVGVNAAAGVETAAGGSAPAGVTAADGDPGGDGGAVADGTRVPAARAIRLEPLAELLPVAFIAAEPVSTAAARGLLPATVPHADAARNAGRAALLIAALTTRPEALLDATEDLLHQDYRAPAMPATRELVARLRAAGIPAVVSGAGPSVLAFCTVGPAGDGNGAYLGKLGSIAGEAGIHWRISPLGVERRGASVEPGTQAAR